MSGIGLHALSLALVVLPATALAGGPADQATPEALRAVDGSAVPVDNRHATLGDEDRAAPVGTAFTYQGLLADGGLPANGQYDMQFTLTDEFGVTVAGPICLDNVDCVDGLFTASLDFGALFNGAARELAVSVRGGGAPGDCANPIGYFPLTPRQKLTATPYALGLRLPFKGAASANGSVIEAANNNTPLLYDWALRGTCGGSANFLTFADSAGVRGDGVGSSVAGVLGVSDNHVGVVGFTAGSGTGVLGRAAGTNGIGVRGIGPGPTGWAGYFDGRGYFSGDVLIGMDEASAELSVLGKVQTDQLQVVNGAANGLVLTSDAAGNATWQPAPVQSTPAHFSSGYGSNPVSAYTFLSPTVLVTVTAGQKIFVTAHKAFGSTAPGGACCLHLFIGYRVSGSGAVPTLVGAGIIGNTVPQDTRFTFGLSGVISGLSPGTYEVGMAGTASSSPGNWNWNEFGYVTALVLN